MHKMTSLERTMAAIGHKEADKIPLFLLLSLYGAKELQIPIKEYFSKAENIVEAQLRMKEKYKNDCLYTFFYAAIEIEAFGGEVIFVEDGPPNSGEPVLASYKDILRLKAPKIHQSKGLLRVLKATRMLKEKSAGNTPIIGVVISPFSLPVIQIGFEKYLDLIYFKRDYFTKLIRINQEFCLSWANAQIEAGADAICYFNPLASPGIIEKETYLSLGYAIDKETIAKIKGPVATHLASEITLPIIEEIISTGSSVLGFSSNDNLPALKKAAKNRICLLGNLNGIDMVNWSPQKAEAEIKALISNAGPGGGLIIADNHGEIPLQVPESILQEISQAVETFGQYPLKWLEETEEI